MGAAFGGASQRDRFSGGIVGSSTDTSAVGGIYAGYNYQFGNNIVLSLDTELDVMDANPRIGTLDSRTNWTGTFQGRVGYAFNPGVMAYASGGGVVGNLSQTFPGVPNYNTVTGTTVGGGVEINLGRLGLNYKFDDGPTVRPSRDIPEAVLRFNYRHQKFTKAQAFGDLRTAICSDVFTVGLAVKFNSGFIYTPTTR